MIPKIGDEVFVSMDAITFGFSEGTDYDFNTDSLITRNGSFKGFFYNSYKVIGAEPWLGEDGLVKFILSSSKGPVVLKSGMTIESLWFILNPDGSLFQSDPGAPPFLCDGKSRDRDYNRIRNIVSKKIYKF